MKDILRYFTEQEKVAILNMAAKQELSVMGILGQSIRVYELIVSGRFELAEIKDKESIKESL